jgi:hypothetical protein
MGFAIVVDENCVSSRPIAPARPIDEYADDGRTVLVPSMVDTHLKMHRIVTECDNFLQAILSIRYYDMIRKNDDNNTNDPGDIVDHTVAELRVQITPLASQFSFQYRDSLFRIRLPNASTVQRLDPIHEHDGKMKSTTITSSHVTISSGVDPQAVISSDRRFLTVLIPHPNPNIHCRSTVVVFQLRKPKPSSTIPQQPPLPSYIASFPPPNHNHNNHDNTPFIPVATNPQMLKYSTGAPFLTATALCDVATRPTSSPSLLLIATTTWQIYAVSYRPLGMAGVLHEYAVEDWDSGKCTNHRSHCIAKMEHLTEFHNSTGTVGRLAVVGNDRISVFRSHIREDELDYDTNNNDPIGSESSTSHFHANITDESIRSLRSMISSLSSPPDEQLQKPFPSTIVTSSLLINLTETHEILQTSSTSIISTTPCWIAASYLAVLVSTSPGALSVGSDTTASVTVYGLYDQARVAVFSEWKTDFRRLEESTHKSFHYATHCSIDNNHRKRMRPSYDKDYHLEYDPYSDCLAVSGHVHNSGNFCHCSFVGIWNWRDNVQGFTATCINTHQNTDNHDDDKDEDIANDTSISDGTLSRLTFAIEKSSLRRHQRLVHTYYDGTLFRKESYNVAVVSPPNHRSYRGAFLRSNSGLLLLSNASLWFPQRTMVSPSSSSRNCELELFETAIPKAYIYEFGIPTIACIGEHCGRSIAVAASRGFCVLDCNSDRIHGKPSTAITGTMSTVVSTYSGNKKKDRRQNNDLTKLLKAGQLQCRWHVFGNETEERSFRVIAMTWWEVGGNYGMKTTHPFLNGVIDDCLVAVIECIEESDNDLTITGTGEFYLSCWSSRELGLRGQLLSPDTKGDGKSSWGLRLPKGFQPAFVDLLAAPWKGKTDELPKACVLLAASDYVTTFRLFQLECYFPSLDDDQKQTLRPYKLRCRCCAIGSVGSPSDLFLASASFDFNFLDDSGPNTANNHPDSGGAILGVIRRYGGGVDAISVSSSQIVAVGQAVDSVDSGTGGASEHELTNYWLADIVQNWRLDNDTSFAFDYFVWILQLANGRLLSWMVPVVRSADDEIFLNRAFSAPETSKGLSSPRSVHSRALALGLVCSAGSTSDWMLQQSVHGGTRNDYLVGFVPFSFFGCIMGVSQQRKMLSSKTSEDFETDLFRPNFMDNMVFHPNEFTLYPPACLPALHSLAWNFAEQRDQFNNHFQLRMRDKLFQNSSMMVLQLLILRCVETLAAKTKRNKRSSSSENSIKRLKVIYASLLEAARQGTTPLQFVTLILKVGRQIEPSCFPCLFPLPAINGTGAGETIFEFFHTSLRSGSINTSVTAVPLLTEEDASKTISAAIFHYCLNEIDSYFDRDEIPLCLAPIAEEEEAAVDIFQYAMKWRDHDDGAVCDETDGKEVPERSYSIICGWSKVIGWMMSSNDKRSQNGNNVDSYLVNCASESKITRTQSNGGRNVKRLSSWRNTDEEVFETVTAVAARYILSTVFDAKALANGSCWIRIAAIAALLVSDSGCQHFCSRQDFSILAQATESIKYRSLLPVGLRKSGGVVKFIINGIGTCRSAIGIESSGHVFDLILALIGSNAGDVKAEVPGLLLLAVVAGQVADRIDDIFSEDQADCPLWTSFFEAQMELTQKQVQIDSQPMETDD